MKKKTIFNCCNSHINNMIEIKKKLIHLISLWFYFTNPDHRRSYTFTSSTSLTAKVKWTMHNPGSCFPWNTTPACNRPYDRSAHNFYDCSCNHVCYCLEILHTGIAVHSSKSSLFLFQSCKPWILFLDWLCTCKILGILTHCLLFVAVHLIKMCVWCLWCGPTADGGRWRGKN